MGLQCRGRRAEEGTMKQAPQQHIAGGDLSEALIILQQLVDAGTSGNFKSTIGSLRLRRGRVVKVEGSILIALIVGVPASWGWRTVPGEPNGNLDADLTSLLLANMAA
jgi:hypothetical protein